MHTTPLHPDFGVEIHSIDLTNISADGEFPAIRRAFEERSLLLFRGQSLDDPGILRLGEMFGPIENRTDGPVFVSKVSNVLSDGTVSLPDAMLTKNLQANMLWHTDSTFLPVPSLANIITARTVPNEGGATELVSTRTGFARLPEALKTRMRSAVLNHRLTHSRQQIDADLAREDYITKWAEQSWQAVWPNPMTGDEALYIASHACGVHGLDEAEGQALIGDLITRMTPEEAIYSHKWRVGDVLIWDERATLHRGQPWPYEQPRTLASICVSATDRDGLAKVRPG